MPFCPHCGKPLHGPESYCSYCGGPIPIAPVQPEQPKSSKPKKNKTKDDTKLFIKGKTDLSSFDAFNKTRSYKVINSTKGLVYHVTGKRNEDESVYSFLTESGYPQATLTFMHKAIDGNIFDPDDLGSYDSSTQMRISHEDIRERERKEAPERPKSLLERLVTPKPRFTQDESYRFEESFNPLGFVSGEQQHVAGPYIARSSKPFGCKKPTKTEIYRDGILVAAVKPKDDKTIVVLFDKKSHREIALLFAFALYLPY
ncbi:hypothetical protein ACTQXJ_01210 [Collinsella sp. LCP19S3_C6]|uniref:hypothetical protein n=1 Tax=unclassified Collinsella TaxID=2637548 RepID=UPI003F926046